ncbi:MAG: 2-hydroxyacyl-CoA dehydratase [Clostridia bacterium]|nr:2-hydroxyacyl-CoA dehydratase [Clostridia bacterium]
MKRLGIDIGSTTLKCAVLDEKDKLVFSRYMRHFSRIDQHLSGMLDDIAERMPGEDMAVSMSGSAGMGLAEQVDIPFVQEVYAERVAVKRLNPETDCVIELGGEDAKILFLSGAFEMRMNGTCAGGTGAFIDQMASLMKIDASEMDALAAHSQKLYTIASRCGVFAKSDIQPLLNQGARKEDVSASIFRAVVNQTIAGLAQGRRIEGSVLYLGGPLTYLSGLRQAFDEVLGTEGLCPENSLYYVAMGAAGTGVGKAVSPKELSARLKSLKHTAAYTSCKRLFESQEEYEAFKKRHMEASKGIRETDAPTGEMYLGVDAGSTTVKAVLCDKDGNLLRPLYAPNNGNPVPIIKQYLSDIYDEFPDIFIGGAASTGYGEEIVKNAFRFDGGIVETVAHYTAARRFKPDVDFILDIGGQDIKCFQIRNGAIDSIYLNEACSSGCGSFLQTFAGAMRFTPEEFARLGLFAKHPVDLGSRCTVFMNSSVKQAQKDGAGVDDIAAGLSISVVKNALYKVIRCSSPDALGKNIVVQGGTFLNDSVLRAFEQETGRNVIRPAYAPIMGAYGAALYAMAHATPGRRSGVIDKKGLEAFTHNVTAITCKGCTNRCSLTVNDFGSGRRFIAGNRCDKPLGKGTYNDKRDLYAYKRQLLSSYMNSEPVRGRRVIGIPMGLNMYELLPFWHKLFDSLGFCVITSPFSTRELYVKGQYTIPSDTACYPAKLMHGHMEYLLDRQPDAIFYPDMSYNIDEGLGVNHFNCPVVAYYPQVLKLNMDRLKGTVFIDDFMSLYDRRQFTRRITQVLTKYFPDLKGAGIKAAVKAAYAEYDSYMEAVRKKGEEYLRWAEANQKPVIVLSGRPYHVDPEVNHGISDVICRLGAVVVTEDSLSRLVAPFRVDVRNQWTYHARLYAAAKYIAGLPPEKNVQLVQLVSFGCGVDAITTDEVRRILEGAGKIYTQIKIDEISNMGAVSIRLRSLLSAASEKLRAV